MAEERNLGIARATETANDEDITKEELQRRMEEARESITQTVEEIKETVANQYQNVRETISQSLDWREQFRRRPVAFSLGALGVGFFIGYGVAGLFTGDGETSGSYSEYEEDEEGSGLGILPKEASAPRSYAAQAITGGAYGSSAYKSAEPEPSGSRGSTESVPESRTSSGGGYQASATESETEPEKPSLIERFKETKAYDRLQAEVATLGERFVDELSKTAQQVVLPALLSKVKDLIGIDLSTQQEVAQRSRLEQQTSAARTSAGSSTPTAQPGVGGSSGGGYGTQSNASSYGTSENRGYSQS